MKRRAFLSAGATVSVMSLLPFRVSATGAREALTDSNLIYLSPVKTNGSLSSCQAEVWYAMIGADVFVCTATSSWRSQAPRKGIANTKIWVGDLGNWRRADYKSLPTVNAVCSVETDASVIEAALNQFGRKYVSEWPTWGPRFRNGLADGSRTMLRYRLT